MLILQDVFGLEKEFLIVKPKGGRFILNEISLSGNMGFSDMRG